MKKFLRILIITLGAIMLIAFLAIAALMLLLAPSKVEVASVISPDKYAIASVTEINGGATTSFGYMIKVQGNNQIFNLSRLRTH